MRSPIRIAVALVATSITILTLACSRDTRTALGPDTHMLLARATVAEAAGPVFSVGAPGFEYTFPDGGVSDPPLMVEYAAPGSTVPVWWSATPSPDATIVAYRWAIDIADIFDETPRVDEATDLRHWSVWSPATVRARVSRLQPAPTSASRRLYIEARDTNGIWSLVAVEIDFMVRRSSPPPPLTDDGGLRARPVVATPTGAGTSDEGVERR
jgi:hypothetical protein